MTTTQSLSPTAEQIEGWYKESKGCEIDFALTAYQSGREAMLAELAGVDVEPVGEVSGNAWDEGLLYSDQEPGAPLYTIDQLAAHNVQTRALVQQLVDALAYWDTHYPITHPTGAALTAGRAWLGGEE